MKQEYHKTLKGQLHGVHEFGITGLRSENDSNTFVIAPNSGILNTLCNFELSFWPQWKAVNHRLRKSANVLQKKTLLSSILEIVASYLIFPNNICKFVLHKKLNFNARGLCVNMRGG